jgi:hypothetical protein
MIILSLVLNVLVLTPICASLMMDAAWVQAGYGPATAARGILLSVYIAIWVVSVLLLFVREPNSVAALLVVQVVYKVTTPLTVGTLANPVVVSNLGIAAFHLVTLTLMWRAQVLRMDRTR